MAYITVAGAPFDQNNLFTIPALDAGSIQSTTTLIQGIDGGNLVGNSSGIIMYDGGSIPSAGTASYDPTKTYTANDTKVIWYNKQ